MESTATRAPGLRATCDRQTNRNEERFHHKALKVLHRAVKKAKAFEVQKAIRQCKQSGDTRRLEAAKAAVVKKLAVVALNRFMGADVQVDGMTQRIVSAAPVRKACRELAQKQVGKRVTRPGVVDDDLSAVGSVFVSSLNGKFTKRPKVEDKRVRPRAKKQIRAAQHSLDHYRRPSISATSLKLDSPVKPEGSDPVHASWTAARAKKLQMKLATFQGRKLKFDD